MKGQGKAQTIRTVDEQLRQAGPDPMNLPITGVNPSRYGGQMTWFLDAPAAGIDV